MIIQYHTDSNLPVNETVVPDITGQLEHALARFAPQLTRVDVYLHDLNGEKSGAADKRCTIEVRASGYEPVAVTCDSDNIITAFHGARDKVVKTLTKRLDRLRHPKAHDRMDPIEQGLGR